MKLPQSLALARVAGITIRVHWTFFLLPAYFGLEAAFRQDAPAGLRAVCLVILIFVLVAAHELCHSAVARAYGIRVPRITLYLIGGVAEMERVPRRPGQEFCIAAAGPLFNLLLAALLYIPVSRAVGNPVFFSPSLDSWSGMASNLYWVNLILGVFNLIPAFPMDGGRMLRAALSIRLGHGKATRISVVVGRLFAILFFLLGIWWKSVMLALVAVFVYTSAGREQSQVSMEEALRRKPAYEKR